MIQQFPALIIVVPLLSAFIIAAAGWLNKKFCFPIAVMSLSISLFTSIGLLLQVIRHHTEVIYRLGGWNPPWGIVYTVDHLNGLILVVISAVAFLNLIATRRNVAEDFPNKIGPFYTLYILFVTGVLGIVVTGDAFNLYVLLEIASLTGYALLAMGDDRAPLASLNYIFMGTIGASFYLLGIGYLYIVTGSLNMADLAAILPGIYHSKAVLFAFIICMTGLFIKMALFPLNAWLPNAYTYAHSSASSLIAPLTTKVMIYVMIRMTLFVFTPQFSFNTLNIGNAFVWLAVAAIIMGSVLALSAVCLKKMLTYILIAEVGYMVGGLWLGNRAAVTGAILHIVNDAMMTLCVFLASGTFIYRIKGDAYENMKGLFRKMPFSMAAFTIGALSIIGVPPTCGFFSKWYLITGGIAAGHYGFVSALLFSSLVNLILFFRIIEIAYFEPFSHHDENEKLTAEEAPAGMLIPLMVAAAGLIVLGIYTGDIVTHIIQFAIPAGIT